MSELQGNLSQVMSRLVAILLDPTSNLTAAFLLYGIIVLLLVVVLVLAIMFLMGTPEEDEPEEAPVEDEEFERLPAGEVYEGREDEGPSAPGEASGGSAEATAKVKTRTLRMSPRGRLTIAALAVLVVAVAWGVTGYTTSDDAVCGGCHEVTLAHTKTPGGSDPHAKVSCVECHEPGGVFGRYVGGVPARLLHFASQGAGAKRDEYGVVTRSACSSCHASGLTGVATNQARGLKVSHKEPLAASATCLDCHAISGGVVATYNAGMGPCLRCHDGKQAPSKCATCHDQKAATAARVRATSFSDVQIPEVTCGGCHDEKKQCDGCHGLRMPHTRAFMTYAHARAGAVDFWYNGGKTCSRCHTAKRRPCTKCHSSLIGHAHGVAPGIGPTHKSATEKSCNGCHGQWAYAPNRDFCKDLCHSPAAIATSPR